ncbi:protein Pry1p [Diutina catenulata]
MKFTFAAALALATAVQAATQVVYVTSVQYVYADNGDGPAATQDAAVTVYVNAQGTTVNAQGVPLALPTAQPQANVQAKPVKEDAKSPETPESKAPEPSAAPAPSSTPSTDSNVGGWEKQMLDEHNKHRANHKAAPLQWDSAAAAYIAKYGATQCGSGGMPPLVHSKNSPYGENLFAATGEYSPASVLDQWCDEARGDGNYNHFSQVVWKGTTGVGCARACNGKWIGCSYSPAGNLVGAYGANVSP